MVYPPYEPVEYNQCQEAVRRLTEYLSHELRPEEADQVSHHLRRCKGCMAKFQFEEKLLRTIRERAQALRTPDELRARILSLLDDPAHAPNLNHAPVQD